MVKYDNYTQNRIKECVRKMKLAQINFKFSKAELKIWLDGYDKKRRKNFRVDSNENKTNAKNKQPS